MIDKLYTLAGKQIRYNYQTIELEPYLSIQQDSYKPTQELVPEHFVRPDDAALSQGMIGERSVSIASWKEENGYGLEIPGAGYFFVSTDGTWLQHLSSEPDADPFDFVQAALGPPLILALALQGVWCMHASAFQYEGNAVALIGESGSGKSTLVDYLRRVDHFQRLADDLLPVAWMNNAIQAFPHFPQLKLAANDQPVLSQPVQLPLTRIYLLDVTPTQDQLSLEQLTSREGVKALLRHTVGARLFDRLLLERHLDFCIQAVSCVSIHRLIYPRRHESLSAVSAALQANLAK
jgi:hypothetical protein